MNKHFNHIIIIFVFSIFISCWQSDNDKIEAENIRIINDLVLKYKANTNWNLIERFSIEYQKLFIEQNQLMLIEGEIYDIIKVDEKYVVKIFQDINECNKNFLAEAIIAPSHLNIIGKINKYSTGGFIIKVLEVSSSNPSIVQDKDESGSYTYLSNSPSDKITVFKGELIEYHINKEEE